MAPAATRDFRCNESLQHATMGDWNLQEWKMTDHQKRGVEIAGLENDGVEQEQAYNTAHDEKLECVQHVIVSSTNLMTYIIPHLELYLLKYDKKEIIQ